MGKTMKSGAREVIYNVFQRCLAEYHAGTILYDLDDFYKRVADMTGKSESTVRRIVKEGDSGGKKFSTPGKHKRCRFICWQRHGVSILGCAWDKFKINELKFELLPHAPFPNLKYCLGGKRRANNEEVESVVDCYFDELDTDHYKQGIEAIEVYCVTRRLY